MTLKVLLNPHLFLPTLRSLALLTIAAVSFAPHRLAAQQRIAGWGDDSYGQLSQIPAYQCVPDIKAVSAGYTHCLALRSNGVVLAWGDNFAGETNIPPSATNVVAIAAGDQFSLALRANGTVVAWGLNNMKQTVVPASLTNAVAIAAGGGHSIALRSDGTVVTWGDGFLGQTNPPAGLTGVKAISAGDSHCLVLRSNGTLAAWGDNASGQTNLPASLTNIMAISAGYHHNLAVRSNGTVAAWELNVYGETTVPAGLSGVAAVAGGDFFSMALKSNGTIVAWGQNFSNQTNIPAGLTNATAIATGYSGHCLAIASGAPACSPGVPDDFACRATLTGSSLFFTASNVNATAEPCEPVHFGFQDVGKSIWYTWTAPFTGGAVISTLTDQRAPCMAVYTGSSLASLTPVVSNSTAFFASRVVFNAVAGTAYQIALDGTSFGGATGQGTYNTTLTLTPPPANDLFANRTVIPGTFFLTSGSFIGATQEVSEPFHGGPGANTSFHQTLWWSWTAPTNLGVSSIPVQLVADAISFPPNIGVYTGASIAGLVAVSNSSQTNGMTRITGFNAIPGTTYQIALGGQQYDPLGVDTSQRVGDFRLRLNIRALVLAFSQINQTNNADGSVSFGANLQVTNFGSAASGPLRVLVTANTGISVLGQDSGFATNGQSVLLVTNLSALNPSQGVVRRILSVVPAPTVNSNVTAGVGFGDYAQLQEQVATNWITVDQSLIVFGNWPDLNGNAGPGGGVIRLDPGLSGPTFNPLTNVNILGPTSINEGSITPYLGRARYSDGFQVDFTNTLWAATRFNITNGIFATGIVTSNTTVGLDVKYSSGGFIFDTTTNVLVIDLPQSKLGQIQLTSSNATLSIQGVPNRKNVLEATASLSPPINWVPLVTNTLDGSGLGTFNQPIGTNRIRFFRARETE